MLFQFTVKLHIAVEMRLIALTVVYLSPSVAVVITMVCLDGLKSDGEK